jgi:hypothetical protein
MNIPVFIFIAIICSLDGLVIFAVYHKCDLAKEKKITRNDQVRKTLNFFGEYYKPFLEEWHNTCLSPREEKLPPCL